MRLFVPLTVLSLAALTPASGAPTNWIDHYIAANGNCQQSFSVLTTVPMGKPIADWTPEDLKLLKGALNHCEAVMNMQLGWTTELYKAIKSLVREQQARVVQQQEAAAYRRDEAEQKRASTERRAAEEKQASLEQLAAIKKQAEQEDADRRATEQHIADLAVEKAAAEDLAAKAEARRQAVLQEGRLQQDIEDAKRRRMRAEAETTRLAAAAAAHRSSGGPVAQARPTPSSPSAYGRPPGVAKICLTDESVHLGPKDFIAIPASTVFQDVGSNIGQASDPSSWAYEIKEGSMPQAAFVTLSPISLKEGARCAQTDVEMLTGPLWSKTTQEAADAHVFTLQDIIDYPPTFSRAANTPI